jgi:sugar phosphate isomerase/epimerase
MAKIPIALQLHSVREDCARDLPGTLAAVANMGYAGVEFAGYHGRSADELREILDKVGLRAAGTHVSIDALLGDELQRTIKFNHILGNRFLIVPWLPEEMRSSKIKWLRTARLMNSIAEKIKPEKMRVGYHNHTFEFQPVDGAMPWDIFFEAANHDVMMQLDTGNAMRGGVSAEGILDIVRRYHGRVATVHLKEFSSKNEQALLGDGEMKWLEFLSLCKTLGGTEWYIIEQESCAMSPIECARRCLENLRKMMR